MFLQREVTNLFVLLFLFLFNAFLFSSCSEKEQSITELKDYLISTNDKADPSSQDLEMPDETFEPPEEGVMSIDRCKNKFTADLSGDKIPETLCVTTMKYKNEEKDIIYQSLEVDVFIKKKRILHQELEREFFYKEQFFALKDIDGDKRSELITQVRLSPYCAGCDAYRIYNYQDNAFVNNINLFSLNPNGPFIRIALKQLPEIKKKVIDYFNTKTEKKTSYGSEIWLLDSNRDGRKEIIQLLCSYTDDIFSGSRIYYLSILELSSLGKPQKYNLFPLQSEGGDVDILGFLRTNNNHTHMLINMRGQGTSTAYPVLYIFEINGNQVKNIGRFCGFYSHVIPERFRDLNGDGNTEIIYVSDEIWPIGGAHADVIPVYSIAEYKNGRYVEADKKYKKFLKKLNRSSQ